MSRLRSARLPLPPPAGVVFLIFLGGMVLASRPSSALEELDTARLDALIGASESVVVATARQVRTAWAGNEYGDRVIVSSAVLEVSETLKGRPLPIRTIEIEGGAVDGVTLEVSDEPTVRSGDRAVFFLKSKHAERDQPLSTEDAVLELDPQDAVHGRGLGLADIRSRARAGR